MKFLYKNGIRYINKAALGYLNHNDISMKLGRNQPRMVELKITTKTKTGIKIPHGTNFQKVEKVVLNRYQLKPRIDYYLYEDSISFTFGLIPKDRIEIHGIV